MPLFLLCILSLTSSGDLEQYKALLRVNYPFLKRACVQVVRWQGGGGDGSDDAEYLLGRVLDHFMEDDYRRLRSGEIRNVKTFFRNCIENLFKDMLVKRRGKDRSKERARELGDLGLEVHELLGRGYSTDAIHGMLSASSGKVLPWEELFRMVQRIKGSNALPPTDGNRVVHNQAEEGSDPEPADFEVVDSRGTPEDLAIERKKYELRKEVLAELADLLDDEGKVMIRLYYLENDEKCTVADIAQYLGKTPKAADNKLRRILAGFREYMMKKGLRPDDLL